MLAKRWIAAVAMFTLTPLASEIFAAMAFWEEAMLPLDRTTYDTTDAAYVTALDALSTGSPVASGAGGGTLLPDILSVLGLAEPELGLPPSSMGLPTLGSLAALSTMAVWFMAAASCLTRCVVTFQSG